MLLRPIHFVTALLVCCGTALAGAPGDENAAPFGARTTRFVVKFSDSGSSTFRKRDGSLDTEGFYQRVRTKIHGIQPALNFTTPFFHGASFDLTAASTPSHSISLSLSAIRSLPEVARIWPVAIVHAVKPLSIGADALASAGKPPRWDPHVLTKVNEAHRLNITGRGVTIAIIDSGIDYMHPAFGRGFGPGFKVEGGHDFVGDNYIPEVVETMEPDDDPMDCMGHGTHVAGIIASGDPDLPGVAPDVKLRSYKVFGCSDGSSEDLMAMALIKAFEDGADIISASLGSTLGFPENIVAEIASDIGRKGGLVVGSAGNTGQRGPFYTSSLANNQGGLTVGSVEHTQSTAYFVVANSTGGETREIVYVSDDSLPWTRNGTLQALIPEDSRDLDICRTPTAARGIGRVSNDRILVIPRGKGRVCENSWQQMDGYLTGIANWIFIYNTPNKTFEIPERTIYRGDQPIGFASINYDDGIWLQEQQEAGHTVSFNFLYGTARMVGIEDSDSVIDFFSAWGGTLDGRLKPEISAPGGRILSTFLTEYGGWAIQSGTSMSTPYISGVAALLYQSLGKEKRASINAATVARDRIISSGNPVRHYNSSKILASVAQQGGGMVDALKVVTFKSSVTPAVIHLNDTTHFVKSHTLTITNDDDKEVTYELAHEAGPTVRTRETGTAWVALDPVLKLDSATTTTVEFSSTKLTIPAGESAKVELIFTEPAEINATVMPVYGGYINVVGSNGEALRATYMGIKGSLYAADIWEIQRGVPQFLGVRGTGDVFPEGTVFNTTSPGVAFNILWATREISFDFVTPSWEPSDWVYPPVPGKNNFAGSPFFFDTYISEWVELPQYLSPRATNAIGIRLGANFTHGGVIPNGEYRVLARALRTFGDPENADDWQFRLSPKFVMEREGNEEEDS